MSPLQQCADAEGRGTRAFLRQWSARTSTPLRADAILFTRSGKAAEALKIAWRGAFGRSLSDEPLTRSGLPTMTFLNEARAVNL